MSFEHLFPATNLPPDEILRESSTPEGAERLLTKLDKDHPYYNYVAEGIAEYHAKNGNITKADQMLEDISSATRQVHVLTEMALYEQDHPENRPLPLETIEKNLYKTTLVAYETEEGLAAANAVVEAADPLSNTDMPELAKKAQAEHPEIKPDLDDEPDDDDLIDLI